MKGKDYTVTLNRFEIGTATATITGIGNYTGTITKTFQISLGTPSLTSKGAKKKATLKWTKVAGASGYVLEMKKSKSGNYSVIKTANSSTLTFTKTGLTSGKTYYYRVRAYRIVNGKKVYSSYSTVKSARS